VMSTNIIDPYPIIRNGKDMSGANNMRKIATDFSTLNLSYATKIELNTDRGNDNAKLAVKIKTIIFPLYISSEDSVLEKILSRLKVINNPVIIVITETNENKNKKVPINFDSNSSLLSTRFLDKYRTMELPKPKSSTLK